jgi:D-glycero-D-manno-heptose 1,7-bisphosphate phosphatase
MKMTKKLVILDRDGVINQDSDQFIKSPEEWIAIDTSLEAMARLNQAGYRIAIATNQSGLSRRLFNMATLNAIHLKMHQAAAACGACIDALFFCPHLPDEGCDCRKPKPGLLRMIMERFGIESQCTPMVGDTRRDLEAGAALGCPVHLVLTGKGQATLAAGKLPESTRVHQDLAAFVTDFLATSTR